jgi:acetylornithine deacetylase/succinyl-diaminopimelate desuccinylase-like protein
LPSRAIASLLVLLAVASLQCRRAEGVARDPIDHEAEEALVSYLRIDTTNPPGNETSGARLLQQLLAKDGIESQLVGSDPNRQSLYARLSSGTTEKAIVLLHHIDVVPAPATEWTKPPFAGLRNNGYIWGRGALDVKSLGIAELMAFVDLKRRKLPLTRDVIYLAVADEELGGAHGCRELLEKHPELFSNVGYVLNEAGYNETIIDKVAFWGIEVQQKVPLFLRLHIKGPPGHSASPPPNGGAMMELIRTLDAISKIETPYRATPAVLRYFHALGATKTDARGEVMREMTNPVDVTRVNNVLGQGYASLLHDTIAITRINGGSCVNCMPANATAEIDVRLLDDEKPEPMIAKIRSLLPKHCELEVLLAGEPGTESASDTDLFRALAAEMKKAEPESAVAAVVSPGTSDSRYFRARGIVAYGIAPFKVNYYDADTVHGADERIRARFFSEGVRLMRQIVVGFCARPAA